MGLTPLSGSDLLAGVLGTRVWAMKDASERYRRLLAVGDSTDRMEFFSDAVFAIAMTLLALDIRLPESSGADLGSALADLAPEYFAYVLSFVLIAVNWTSHHRKFRVIIGYNARLMQLNLVLLLFIAFLPFPTSVLSEHAPEAPAVVLYAASVGAIGMVQYLLWAYARRAGLLDPSLDRGVYRLISRTVLGAPAVFFVSIVIAAVGQPLLAMWSWLLIAPASALIGRTARDRPDDLLPAVVQRVPETD